MLLDQLIGVGPLDHRHRRVVLRLLVSERGEVDAVSVLASELPAPAADAVGAAFRALRFSPGEWFGEPVKSRLDVEVTVAAD